MPLAASFPLGPFMVSETGRLSLGSPDSTPGFTFKWRNRPVHVCLSTPDSASGQGVLRLDVCLGRIPSTGGGESAERLEFRARLFATLRAMPLTLPGAWQLLLRPDHSVALATDRHIAMPATAVELVTETTMFVLALAPYLDVLDEEGFGGESPYARAA